MTPSIDQALHQFFTLLLIWTLLPNLTLWEVSIEHLQRVRHANRGSLLLGPVQFWICKYSLVETTDTQSYITLVYDTFPRFDFLQTLTFLLDTGFQRASSGHQVLSHFGTCKCSNVETNVSWPCLVSGLLSFEDPSVLLFLLQAL